MVPSVFETWVNATSFGFSRSSTSRTSRRRIAVVGDRDELEVAVLLLDQDLPRDEVCVVLHLGEDDLVAAADVLAAPRIRDEVDRLGRVAGEDDLVAVRRVDEPPDAGAGLLVLGRRLLADRVDAAMDVGVVLAVVVGQRIDDDRRLLAGRRGVEVDQRVPVDLLLEDRERRRGARPGRACAGRRSSVIGGAA